MKRLQKQLRDLREELQEAERKEQEQNKKRRALVRSILSYQTSFILILGDPTQ